MRSGFDLPGFDVPKTDPISIFQRIFFTELPDSLKSLCKTQPFFPQRRIHFGVAWSLQSSPFFREKIGEPWRIQLQNTHKENTPKKHVLYWNARGHCHMKELGTLCCAWFLLMENRSVCSSSLCDFDTVLEHSSTTFLFLYTDVGSVSESLWPQIWGSLVYTYRLTFGNS